MNSLKRFGLIAACCLWVSGCAADKEPEVVVQPSVAATYPDIAREMSDGRVQMFSLDGPAEPIAPLTLSPPHVQDGGLPYSADPNVTVYPMFEETARPQSQRPVLSPPSDQYRPMESPFGGPLQTPAPVGYLETPPAPAIYPEPRHSGMEKSVFFKHGSSSLDEAGRSAVHYTARNTGGRITVDGFASERAETTDPVERSIVNLKVSMDRAFKVSSDLIRNGVPAAMIETRAFGDTRPPPPGSDDDRDAASRRVDIHAEDGGGASSGDALIPPLERY